MLVTLVAVTLAVAPPLADAFSLVKLAVLVGGMAVLVAFTTLRWAVGGWRRPRKDDVTVAALALAAWTAVATVVSIDAPHSALGTYAIYDGLITRLAVVALFAITAAVVRPARLKTFVTVVVVAAGVPAMAYALVQLHDRLTSWGGEWDPLPWAGGGSWVWSTFSNPNHLAGFIVTLLPLGLALVLVDRSRWRRALVAVTGVGGMVVLVYGTARGAWLGAVAGGATFVALTWTHFRQRPKVLAATAGVLAAAALAGVLTIGAGQTGEQVASLVQPGGSTAVERTELWGAGWRMAVDRPLTGVGPDAYPLLFNRYQTPRFVAVYQAADLTSDTPMNVFVAQLTGTGFVGLGLFVALLVVVGRRARLALRSLADDAEHERRVLLAGVVAAIVAFLVQGLFNTQVLELTVLFWALLGVLVGVGSRVLGQPEPTERRARPPRVLAAVTMVAVVGAGVWACWQAGVAYRADRSEAEADAHGRLAVGLAEAGRIDEARREAAVATRHYDEALDLAPWQKRYWRTSGRFHFNYAGALWSTSDEEAHDEAVALFAKARRLYRQAVDEHPEDGLLLGTYALVLDGLVATGDPALDHSDELLTVALRAREANPLNPTLDRVFFDHALRRPAARNDDGDGAGAQPTRTP